MKMTYINLDAFIRNCFYHRCVCAGDECLDYCDFKGNHCFAVGWREGEEIPQICYDSQREKDL